MDFWSVTLKLLDGFGQTLLLFFLTWILAVPLGLVLCFGSRSKFKPLKYLVRTFIYIIRGTPLLLQLLIVTLGPGIIFNSPITRWGIFELPIFGMFESTTMAAYFFGALIAFVINYACYFSEIFRGGIDSIPLGQYEAGQVLGMTKSQIFFKIILLQVIKNILAPMSNETITLVKDTSLARTVSVCEVLYEAERFATVDALIWPLFYTGVFYLIFNTILTVLFAYLEKRLSKYKIA